MITSCCGPSLALRSGSLSGEPIMNLPAGMTIITGQPFAHSLKSEPGFAAFAFSCATVSTVGSIAMRQRSCPTTCCAMAPRSMNPRAARPNEAMRPATSTLPRRARARDARSATRQRSGMVRVPHTVGRLPWTRDAPKWASLRAQLDGLEPSVQMTTPVILRASLDRLPATCPLEPAHELDQAERAQELEYGQRHDQKAHRDHQCPRRHVLDRPSADRRRQHAAEDEWNEVLQR